MSEYARFKTHFGCHLGIVPTPATLIAEEIIPPETADEEVPKMVKQYQRQSLLQRHR